MGNYLNDPMQDEPPLQHAKSKRKVGCPRKIEIIPPHIKYNTRHRSVSEAETLAAIASNTTFKINDDRALALG